jgi:hypothetical protein
MDKHSNQMKKESWTLISKILQQMREPGSSAELCDSFRLDQLRHAEHLCVNSTPNFFQYIFGTIWNWEKFDCPPGRAWCLRSGLIAEPSRTALTQFSASLGQIARRAHCQAQSAASPFIAPDELGHLRIARQCPRDSKSDVRNTECGDVPSANCASSLKSACRRAAAKDQSQLAEQVQLMAGQESPRE